MNTSSKAPKPVQNSPDPFFYLRPMGQAAAFGTTWLESVLEISGELASFASLRMKEDMQAQYDLMRCTSLTQMQHVQAKFVQDAITQYHAETARLVGMATRQNGKPIWEG